MPRKREHVDANVINSRRFVATRTRALIDERDLIDQSIGHRGYRLRWWRLRRRLRSCSKTACTPSGASIVQTELRRRALITSWVVEDVAIIYVQRPVHFLIVSNRSSVILKPRLTKSPVVWTAIT
jgi:hypothetical protein